MYTTNLRSMSINSLYLNHRRRRHSPLFSFRAAPLHGYHCTYVESTFDWINSVQSIPLDNWTPEVSVYTVWPGECVCVRVRSRECEITTYSGIHTMYACNWADGKVLIQLAFVKSYVEVNFWLNRRMIIVIKTLPPRRYVRRHTSHASGLMEYPTP